MGNCISRDETEISGKDGHKANGHIGRGGPQQHGAGNGYGYGYGGAPDNMWDEIQQEIEEQLEKNVKDDLDNNPEQLLVNFILMSVQFLKHFEKDKEQMITDDTKLKRQFDQALKDKKKFCVLPGGLPTKSFEYVSLKEEGFNTVTPLFGRQVILFYSNIEVKEENGSDEDISQHYADLDNPNYRVSLEPAKNFGYMKIRCKDDPTKFNKAVGSFRSPSPTPAQSISSIDLEPNRDRAKDDQERLQVFLNSSAAQSRPSYDEPHPDGLPKIAKKPAETIRRSSSFNTIKEKSEDAEEDDGPDPDFMSQLKRKVESVPNSQKLRLDGTLSPLPRPIPERNIPTSPSPTSATPNSLSVPNSRRGSRNSRGSRGSLGSDFGYAVLKETSLPPEEFGRNSIINSECFQYRDVPFVEDEEEQPYPIDAEDVKRCYLSSEQMLDNFCRSQIYDITKSINKPELTRGAKQLPLSANVICREEDDDEDSDNVKESMWYFMPSLDVPYFPSEYKVSFLYRKREKMRHKRTGTTYQWPTEKMVQHITQLGCNLAPVGYQHPKKDKKNPDSNIEWEVFFTKAEQYMTRNFQHPKIRVYMFSLLMLKCHFERFDGLREKHIRHALYWLLEKNPVDWTEENVGEKFMDLWFHMKTRLSKRSMPNFFIQRNNMFSNVPNHRLSQAHERVHRMNENPVMFILTCLQKVHFKKDFYPILDVMELHRILTMPKEDLLYEITPELKGNKNTQIKKEQASRAYDLKGDNYQKRMQMKRIREREKRDKEDGSENKMEDDTEDINLEQKMQIFTNERKFLVLKFFLTHFIEMTERSNKFRHKGQAYLYMQMSKIVLNRIKALRYEGKVLELENKLRSLKSVVDNKDYFREYWSISNSPLTRIGSHDLPLPDAPTPTMELNEDTLDHHFRRSNSEPENPDTSKEISRDIFVKAMVHTLHKTNNSENTEKDLKMKVKVKVEDGGSKTKDSKVRETQNTSQKQPTVERVSSKNSFEEKLPLERKSSKKSVENKTRLNETSIIDRETTNKKKVDNEVQVLSKESDRKDIEETPGETKEKENVRSLKIRKKDNFKQKYRKSNIELELNFLKETEKIISQVKDKNKVVVSNSVRKNSDGNASPESEVADNIEAEDSEPEETYL